ncbi:hypothetical protein VTO73DRAFT_9790 [Trametes versicolor]
MAVRSPSPMLALPDPQPAVRIVLWFANDVPARMKMEPVDTSNNLDVSNIDWIIEACGGDSAFWCEIWSMQQAGWEVYALGDPKVPVLDSRAAILMRVGGVARCLNFGDEVEMLNRHFSIGFQKSLQGDFPRTFSEYAAWAQVIIWAENGVKPAMYHLPLEPDGSFCLTSHAAIRALWTHPSDPEGELVLNHIDVWIPEETEWRTCRIDTPFMLLPVHRTLLMKNTATWCTLDMGDVLARLDEVARADGAPWTPGTPNLKNVDESPSRGRTISFAGKHQMTSRDICQEPEGPEASNTRAAQTSGLFWLPPTSTLTLMRRDAPRRYRLYKYPDARPEGLDPLSKPPRSGYTPEMRALCKKYRYKGPPVLHQCPVCKSPVKKQLMYARGWAAADQYICLKNSGNHDKGGKKRKKKPHAHITRPDQPGPSDEQLLEIEALREQQHADSLDPAARAIFEQVAADEALARRLAAGDEGAGAVGRIGGTPVRNDNNILADEALARRLAAEDERPAAVDRMDDTPFRNAANRNACAGPSPKKGKGKAAPPAKRSRRTRNVEEALQAHAQEEKPSDDESASSEEQTDEFTDEFTDETYTDTSDDEAARDTEKGVPFGLVPYVDLAPYVDPPVEAGCATLQEAMSGPVPYVELDADGLPVLDPNSELYASGQDLLLVNAALAALRAESGVPSTPDEDPEQYAARKAANLWPCEFDEMSHRQNVYTLFLVDKLGFKDVPLGEPREVGIRSPITALFLWTENGMTPTVLRVSTRTVGKLYLEDLSFCRASARSGPREFEFWELEFDRWQPVRDGCIDVNKGLRSVVLRSTNAHQCMDLGKVLTAICTVGMPTQRLVDQYELEAFQAEKRILRRERADNRITVVVWEHGGLGPYEETLYLAPNRQFLLSRVHELRKLDAAVKFELWDPATTEWKIATRPGVAMS